MLTDSVGQAFGSGSVKTCMKDKTITDMIFFWLLQQRVLINEDNCKEKKYYSHCQPIKRIAFTLDDKKVVTIAGKDKSIFIWEIQQD